MSGELVSIQRRAVVHAALADPARLAIVDRLLLADASPTELQSSLAMPSNLIAHHLKVLEDAGLLRRMKSEADRRRTYLKLNRDTLAVLVPATEQTARRVVFVCTHNSARSQMAAAIWNRLSAVPATSAGTRPADAIHPGALAAAQRHHVPIEPSTPRHVTDVLTDGDLLIAVCDNAHETLPPDLDRLHWSVADPARSATADAFDTAFGELTDRVRQLSPSLQPA